MFIEHIDRLRCTVDHEESWLVASLVVREDRFIVQGTLGCHVCLRRYPIIDGIAYFGSVPDSVPISILSSVPANRLSVAPASANAEMSTRIAALLNVTERSTLVLAGEWALHGHAITEMLPLTVFALDPSVAMRDSASLAIVSSSEGIPLAGNSTHGVALDAATATPKNIASALKVISPGGRLVAPTSANIPAGVRLLASDESYWVGEREGALIPLRRA
jgi:uncharacterized protein YbaR (Trm112 family)